MRGMDSFSEIERWRHKGLQHVDHYSVAVTSIISLPVCNSRDASMRADVESPAAL